MNTFVIKSIVTQHETKFLISEGYPRIIESWSNGCTKIEGKFKCYINNIEFLEYDLEEGYKTDLNFLINELSAFGITTTHDQIYAILTVINSGKYESAPHHNLADMSLEAQLARIVLSNLVDPTAKEFAREAFSQSLILGFSRDVLARCIRDYA